MSLDRRKCCDKPVTGPSLGLTHIAPGGRATHRGRACLSVSVLHPAAKGEVAAAAVDLNRGPRRELAGQDTLR